MRKKPLGPPPDWIRSTPAAQPPRGDKDVTDPLRSMFTEARVTRTGEEDDRRGLLKVVHERGRAVRADVVVDEVKRRLRTDQQEHGAFAAVYAAPGFTADVPDSHGTRLVILGPAYWHAANSEDTRARRAVTTFLLRRGAGPRRHRNTLVFLAPDRLELDALQRQVRDYLAWKSLVTSPPDDLDPEHMTDARARLAESDAAIAERVEDTYCWLITPTAPSREGPVLWKETRLQGRGPLASVASTRLVGDGALVTGWTGSELRSALDAYQLWQGDHVSLQDLADAFACDLSLPRLRDDQVLLEAVRDGLAQISWFTDAFAFASGHDPLRGKYLGLTNDPQARVSITPRSVLVRPEAAVKYLDESGQRKQRGPAQSTEPVGAPAKPYRFQGATTLDSVNFGRDAGKIRLAVVELLNSLGASDIRIGLNIEADIYTPQSEEMLHRLEDNCRALEFTACEVHSLSPG